MSRSLGEWVALAGVEEQQRPGGAWLWREELRLLWQLPRRPQVYLAGLWTLFVLILAYQVVTPTSVAVGGGYDAPFVRGFHEREDGRRFATDAARVLLPGVGARDSALLITAATRPDGRAEPVRVVVNGIALGSFTPTAERARYRFELPERYYSYGDLTIDLLSTPQLVPGRGSQPLPYGPSISEVRVEPTGGSGLAKPPLWALLAWGVASVLLLILLQRIGVHAWVALGIAGGVAALGAALVPFFRLDLAIFVPRLAVLLALGYLLLVILERWLPRLFARGGVTIELRDLRRLQWIVLFALVIKLGGIIHPQLFVIDRPFHHQQFEKVLQGRFLELYLPDSSGISAVPGHWGFNAQIPYSPFLYLFGLPFYLGPFDRAIAFDVWSGLLDLTRIAIVYFLARRLGGSPRAALIAALVMAVTACTFLLHSWGNYPTTVSQWSALFFLALLVAAYPLKRPWVGVALTLVLALTMLLYTVTAVFIGLVVLLLLGYEIWRGRWRGRRAWLPLAGVLVGGSAIAFLAYYVQYVGPVITETLPSFGAKLAQDEVIGGAEPESLASYFTRYAGRLLYYGVLVSLTLAPWGVWILRQRRSHPLAVPLLTSWFAVSALFMVLALRLDMVDKEVWFVVPAAAICAGIAGDALLQGMYRTALRTVLGGWIAGFVVLTLLGVNLATLDPNRFTAQFLALSPFAWLGLAVAVGAVGAFWARGWSRPAGRIDQVLLALYLGYLTCGGIALWLFRIGVVRH
jgi:hypothetical protein